MKDLLKFGPLPMIMSPDDDKNAGAGVTPTANSEPPAQGGGVQTDTGLPKQTDKPADNSGTPATDQQQKQPSDPIQGDAGNTQKGDKKPEGIWGEGWREDYAKEDVQKLALLKRYSSPKDVIDALIEAKNALRSGAHKQGLSKDATPEQVAEYRKQNGIPEKAEDYLAKLPEGLVLGEDDRAGAEAFLKDAHNMNLPPEVVGMALKAYVDRQEAYTLSVQERDNENREVCTEEIKRELGPDYNRGIEAMRSFIETTFSSEIQEALMNARLGNGVGLFNEPQLVKFFIDLASSHGHNTNLMPGVGYNSLDTIESKIAEYEKRMREDRVGWFKDQKARDHHKELLAARERFKKA